MEFSIKSSCFRIALFGISTACGSAVNYFAEQIIFSGFEKWNKNKVDKQSNNKKITIISKFGAFYLGVLYTAAVFVVGYFAEKKLLKF
jgi:hypothetical protein